eukprot:s487_g1.t1
MDEKVGRITMRHQLFWKFLRSSQALFENGALWFAATTDRGPNEVAAKNIQAYISKHLGIAPVFFAASDCLEHCAEARPREAFEDEAMLTIHLRGEDVREKPLYQQNQPPCRMYDRILSDAWQQHEEHSYKSVSVVKVGWTACDGFIRGLGKRMKVRVQASSIVEDFAMLMRARNLAVSFSSFAMSAAILSKEIQVMYRRRDAEWDSVPCRTHGIGGQAPEVATLW